MYSMLKANVGYRLQIVPIIKKGGGGHSHETICKLGLITRPHYNYVPPLSLPLGDGIGVNVDEICG